MEIKQVINGWKRQDKTNPIPVGMQSVKAIVKTDKGLQIRHVNIPK